MLTASDYAILHKLVFADDYPGYKPEVVESPNGDGKLDSAKRYSHVAEKYLSIKKYPNNGLNLELILQHNENVGTLHSYLAKAHDLATQVAISIGVPPQFWPCRKESALRVLEYGPLAVSHEHTDFDLFTLSLYRNLPEYFVRLKPTHNSLSKEWVSVADVFQIESALRSSDELKKRAEVLNPQVHFGELLQEIDPSCYVATPHEVQATRELPSQAKVGSGEANGPWQYSVVYFAMPPADSHLPSGMTVGEWVKERKDRSRYDR